MKYYSGQHSKMCTLHFSLTSSKLVLSTFQVTSEASKLISVLNQLLLAYHEIKYCNVVQRVPTFQYPLHNNQEAYLFTN